MLKIVSDHQGNLEPKLGLPDVCQSLPNDHMIVLDWYTYQGGQFEKWRCGMTWYVRFLLVDIGPGLVPKLRHFERTFPGMGTFF